MTWLVILLLCEKENTLDLKAKKYCGCTVYRSTYYTCTHDADLNHDTN